jgi:putative zinc finger/helix-turn-helix YgiT family protein
MHRDSDIQCGICSSDNVRTVREQFMAKYLNIPIVLDSAEMYRCEDCGESFFSPEQARNVSKAIKAAARDRLGLLPPERIVEIRHKLSLSQEKMESLLGLGPKVVTRWENGRVLQSKTADDLLRIMEKLPEAVSVLKDIRESTRPLA